MKMEKSVLLIVFKELEDKEQQIEECKREIENKDTELRNREKTKGKDALLKNTCTKLEKITKELLEKESALHERDQQLKLKDKQLQDARIQVEEMEKRLVENMNKLSEKDTQLKQKDKELQSHKNQLETLGQELQDKKRELQEMKTGPSTSTEAASLRTDTRGADFMDKHRAQLIQRVKDPSVMAIADHLKSKNMINDEMYNNIKVESTSHEKMRLLYEHINSEGRAVKAEVYKLLKKKHPYMMKDLESGWSLA